MRSSAFLVAAATVLLSSLAGGAEVEKTKASDFGLRGPVKQCVEQTTHLADGAIGDRSFTTKSLYSPGGFLVEGRSQLSSGPDFVTTYSYDAAGRLLKRSSGLDSPTGADKDVSAYAYDDKGQLLRIASDIGEVSFKYEDDGNGRTRKVEQLAVFAVTPNTGVGAICWENSELAFGPPSGGTVTTLYNEQVRPVEGQVRDSDGRIMLRIVRTYDAKGRVQSDKMTPEDMAGKVPAEWAGQMNDAQKQALARFMGNAFATGESTFKYDSEGRVVEKRITGGLPGNILSATTYNEHGDVSSEMTVATLMADVGTEYGMTEDGKMVAVSKGEVPAPSQSENRYTYEYDAQGNWTKSTMATRSGPGEFKNSTVIERTLSYY